MGSSLYLFLSVVHASEGDLRPFFFPSTSFGRRSQTLEVDEAGDPVRRASGHPQQRQKPVLLLHEHD